MSDDATRWLTPQQKEALEVARRRPLRRGRFNRPRDPEPTIAHLTAAALVRRGLMRKLPGTGLFVLRKLPDGTTHGQGD